MATFLATLFVSPSHLDQETTIRSIVDLPPIGILMVGGACAALYWRRSEPIYVLGVVVAIELLSTALGYPFDSFGAPFALYSVGRYASNYRWSVIGLSATIFLILLDEFAKGKPLAEIVFGIVVLSLVWYIGERIRLRGDYLKLLQERALHLEREHDNEARRAVVEERARIARELHDVVAHRVSLMTVQAGAATTVAAENPEAAIQAMKAVESEGRLALAEMRHLMGVLRPDADVDGLVPQPGIVDIPRLIESLGNAGLTISLQMDGALDDLSALVDLSAYRIVQEALTNVLKHAGSVTRTDVRISRETKAILIEVRNDGQSSTSLPGTGHGIVGMRERAQLLGGWLNAGRQAEGGFEVVAHLPFIQEPK